MQLPKPQQLKDEGGAELIPYALMPEPGIIQTKHGELIACWAYRGRDLETASPSELHTARLRVNNVVRRLTGGWTVHVDMLRYPLAGYEQSAFDAPVLQLLEHERAERLGQPGATLSSINVISVVWSPPIPHAIKARRLLYTTEGPDGTHDLQNLATEAVNEFRSHCDEIEGNLQSVFYAQRLQTERLNERVIIDRQLQFIAACLSGYNHPMRLPPVPMYLDTLLGFEIGTGIELQVNEARTAVIAIDGFPLDAHPQILADLERLPFGYRWSNRFAVLDNSEAVASLNRRRRYWAQSTKTMADTVMNRDSPMAIDRDALNMVDDAAEAAAEVRSGIVRSGIYTSVVIVRADTPNALDKQVKTVRQVLQDNGFNARREDINGPEAFFGSLPGNTGFNIRDQQVNSFNLADMIPSSNAWEGSARAPCPYYPKNSPPLLRGLTTGKSLFNLNLHVGDVGHTLVAGPTGYGKSTLIAAIIANFFRYPGAQGVVLDNKRSLMPISLPCGGVHYDLGSDHQQVSAAPFADLSTPARRAWADDYLRVCAELNGLTVSVGQQNELTAAVNRVAASGGRSFTDMRAEIQDAELREALKYYPLDGALGSMLDGTEETNPTAPLQCYETEELLKRPAKAIIPTLMYFFDQFERRLTGRPTLLVISEAWTVLLIEAFRERLRGWFKRLRDKNVAIILDTQQLSDIANSPIREVIFENTLTKILTPNAQALDTYSRPFYEALGLEEHHMALLRDATPKQDYLYWSTAGRRLFQLNLGPAQLAFCGATGEENITALRECIAEHGTGR